MIINHIETLRRDNDFLSDMNDKKSTIVDTLTFFCR